MKEITLENLTDAQLQSEAELLINMLRDKYPRLDLRRGTVLRDLLVDTDAAVGAMFAAQAQEQRDASSLLVLSERASAGEQVDQDDVNAILSNFNMASVSGTKARGHARVVVNSGDVNHTVLAGTRFRTSDDVYFVVSSDVIASADPSGSQVKQYATGTGLFWYLVPLEAVDSGAAGNIEQGLALEPVTALGDFVSASAYTAFSGGSDLEALDKTVGRIKSSLSMRGLTSATAVEAQLRDRFDDTDHPIVAVSVCGYGNRAQLRDKHNPFGTAVGGRADVYVRNFTDLPLADNKTRTGRLVGTEKDIDGKVVGGVFEIDIFHNDRSVEEDGEDEDGNPIKVRRVVPGVPGVIGVHSVSDPDSQALSSYIFEVKYSGNVSGVWHDFDVSSDVHELANTAWRDLAITVRGVPVTEQELESGTKDFRVELVALPGAAALQDYVDDGLVRNVAADFVVRGPMVVNTSVKAVVRYRYSTGFDVSKAVSEICQYVNTTGFIGRLTRSEISAILMNLGAASVDLFDENEMLYGYVYDAYGEKHELSGDALDLEQVATSDGMLTGDTAVFVVEPKNVQIVTIAV